jgi:hypothetical protein
MSQANFPDRSHRRRPLIPRTPPGLVNQRADAVRADLARTAEPESHDSIAEDMLVRDVASAIERRSSRLGGKPQTSRILLRELGARGYNLNGFAVDIVTEIVAIQEHLTPYKSDRQAERDAIADRHAAVATERANRIAAAREYDVSIAAALGAFHDARKLVQELMTARAKAEQNAHEAFRAGVGHQEEAARLRQEVEHVSGLLDAEQRAHDRLKARTLDDAVNDRGIFGRRPAQVEGDVWGDVHITPKNTGLTELALNLGEAVRDMAKALAAAEARR